MPSHFAVDRAAFLAALNGDLARDRMGVAVVRIDLDRFSRIRQVFGRVVAGRVRLEVVSRLQAMVAAPMHLLAYSEDSFAAVVHVTDTSLDALELVGMTFVEAVSEPIRLVDQPAIAVGSNAGIAAASHFEDVDAMRLLAGAEFAVQEAAGLGSRRVLVYQVAPSGDPTRIPELYADMLEAVHLRQFRPYFQPVVGLPQRTVVGAEALVRWIHPTHGVLPPGDFLPEAERSGLIRDIDASVWEQAWSLFALMPTGDEVTMSVNLSPADLDFPGLVEKVQEHLASTGIAPQRLIFEVTETALAKDWEHARRRLAGLKGLGCSIAVDDFGSGHMFLDRLATGLFDIIKIDRSLVSPNDPADERNLRLLEGVTSMTRSLGLTTVAEGVETEGQLRRVIEAGCDHAQGFLFARPMPGTAFAQFLSTPEAPH